MPNDQAERLFQKVLATGDGKQANQLLEKFVAGYPLEQLRLLLRSNNPEVVKVGAFIASELGRSAFPLTDEFHRLLKHEEFRVRYQALDCVLVCASEDHGELIAQAIGLVRDPDNRVRRKAIGFLSRASQPQLKGALQYLEDPELNSAIKWLSSEQSSSRSEVETELESRDNPMKRRVAVAAAARPINTDNDMLVKAAASDDEDVATFASNELRIFSAIAAKQAERVQAEQRSSRIRSGSRRRPR